MKRAIGIPYVVDQRCPSDPIDHIIELPDNIEERNEILREEFLEAFDVDAFSHDFVFDEEPVYGDLSVCLWDDMFLYVTYIQE